MSPLSRSMAKLRHQRPGSAWKKLVTQKYPDDALPLRSLQSYRGDVLAAGTTDDR